METVTSADGTPIAYERTGSGPPLVLVHGATADHTTWVQALPFLEEQFTVYGMDRRGRGESGDAEDYALDREVEDVVAVVESIGEPVHLLGHSFGGFVSLEVALRADSIRRLVLYEPGVTVDHTDWAPALAEVRSAIEAGDNEEALVVFYREVAHLTEEELEYIRIQPTWSRRVEAVHTALRETEIGQSYEFQPDRFREMTTPTLLLVGEESPTEEHQDAETLHDVLSNSRITVLEDQQHAAYRMAPERFAEAVIAFLTETSRGRGRMNIVTSADGTPIAYERTGSGPPLVLVHGTTADHTRWAPVLPFLEESFTVYAIDRRGRGGSGDVDAYELEREFEDVAAAVESIDEPVILHGHSYGALCSLEAALRTDNLRRLVLYEPPLPVSDHDPDTEDVLDKMTALVDDGENEQALVRFFREIVRVPTAELDALRSAPNWPARVDAAYTAIREERARKGYEFDAARFAGVTTPTLLLSGSESAPLLKDATDVLNDALPKSRIAVLDGQAHAAMNTAPELFIDEVLAFIQESN